MAVPLSILDTVLRDEPLLKLGQAFVHVPDMLCCTNDLFDTVATTTFAPRVAVWTMMIASSLPLFLDPSREATDPRFEFHVLAASNEVRKNDVIFVLVSVLLVTFLSKPTTNFTVNLLELVADVAMVAKLPEGLLQLPVSVGFLFVKLQAGFL